MEDYSQYFEYREMLSDGRKPYEKCAEQVAIGTLGNVLLLIALVIIYKMLKYFRLFGNYLFVFNILASMFVVAVFSADSTKALFIFFFISVISLKMAQHKVNGYLILGIGIAVLILTQLTSSACNEENFFLSIRGVLMMHIMRLATVAFEAQKNPRDLTKWTNFGAYVDYVFCPPFLIFGPYLTVEEFKKMSNTKHGNREIEIGRLAKFIVIIFFGITLAIVSSCQVEFYIPSIQIVEDALTALSFRFSHYFVCMMGYAFAVFLGSGVEVTNIVAVEFPRSVLSIVVEWNKPFRTFLHKYVFQRHFFQSTALNVLLTFVVSSFLHGLDFQMTITLLALGFIAYSETMFRKRLAARRSMCILSKPCKKHKNRLTCNHRYTDKDFQTNIAEGLFTLLAMYHLVFTGMTFTDDYSATGYPLDHALSIWGTHYYASLVISAIFLILSKII